MGTNCFIGVQRESGAVTFTRCYYSGDLESMGPLLQHRYDTRSKALQILARNREIRVLRDTVKDSEFYEVFFSVNKDHITEVPPQHRAYIYTDDGWLTRARGAFEFVPLEQALSEEES